MSLVADHLYLANPVPPAGGLFGSLKPPEKKDGASPGNRNVFTFIICPTNISAVATPAPAFNLFGGTKSEEKKVAPVATVSTSLGQPASKDASKAAETTGKFL